MLQKPATETMSIHKSTRPRPRSPKTATTMSKLVSFCSRQTVFINQPLKSRLFLHWFTSQTLISVVQSVMFSVHQLRGQDGAGRSLPAMPTAVKMRNLSPSSGSALLSRKGHLSRVSAQDEEDTHSACRGRGRERNVHSYIVWRHVLRPIHRGQLELHPPDRRHLPPTIRVCVTLFLHACNKLLCVYVQKCSLCVNFCLVITSK